MIIFFSFFLTHPRSDGTSIKSSSICFLLLFFDKKEAQKKCEASFPIVSKELPFIYSNIEKEKFGKNISQWPREKKMIPIRKNWQKTLNCLYFTVVLCSLQCFVVFIFYRQFLFFTLLSNLLKYSDPDSHLTRFFFSFHH